MSITHKAKDRNDQGRLKPKYTQVHMHHGARICPGWFASMFMNRPQRLKNRALCRALLRGEVDADEVIFPTGNRKPHAYYW